jgi:hypothetical protein
MALGHPDFNELLSSTVQKLQKELVDNVMKAHPTLDFLKANISSEEGPAVALPIVAVEDGSTVFTDASGTFNTSVSNPILGTAKYEWSEPLVSKIRVQFKQLEMNAGPSQVVSLAKAYLDNAVKGHGKTISETLHLASKPSGSFNTLAEIVRATDTLSGTSAVTLGGIRGGISTADITDKALTSNVATIATNGKHDFVVGDTVVIALDTPDAVFDGTHTITAVNGTQDEFSFAKTNANVPSVADTGTATVAAIKDYWRSTVTSSPKTGGSSVNILVAFRQMSDDIYVASGERPNAIVAGRDVFAEYEAYFDDKVRFTTPGGAEGRFREVDFDGIPVRLDPDCPVDTAYFINTDYLVARYLNSNFMSVRPSQQIVGTQDTVTPLLSILCVGTSNRRAHGKLVRV